MLSDQLSNLSFILWSQIPVDESLMGWDGSEAVGCAGVGYTAEVRRVQGYLLVRNIYTTSVTSVT